MFKLTFKLLTLTALLTVGFLFVSGSQASALTNNCSWAPGTNWGNAGQGGGSGLMGSLMVHTIDMGNGGAPLNVNYTLNSRLPNNPNPNLDKRIFQWPIGTGRDAQHTFSTGEHLGNGSGGYNCNGWSVLGPGTSDNVGNGWVLDCGGANLGEGTSRFWISRVENPGGAPGKWKLILNDGGSESVLSQDVNNDSAHEFGVINGGNVRLRLEWHPDPVDNTPDVASECNTLYVRDGGTWTRPSDGKVFSSGDVRTKVRVEDTGGHVLVHPENDNPSQYFYLNNEDRTWTYTPLARGVRVIVIREYKSSSGVWNFAEDNSRTHNNCYQAGYGGVGCSISAAGNVAGKPIGVKAGSTVMVTVSIANTGTLRLPSQLAGHEFWLDSDGGQTGGLQSINIRLPAIGVGRTFTTTTAITAPSTVGHYTFSTSPVYRGLFYPEDRACTYTIDVYQNFTGSLNASTTLTSATGNPSEDPNGANYSTSVGVNPSSPQVYIPTNSTFYKIPFGGSPQTLASGGGGVYPGGWNGNYPIAPGSFNAGDQFCARIDAPSYLTGLIGPNGPYDVAETGNPGSSDPPPHCAKIVNEPYAHFFGSDVSSGGGFGIGQSCVQTSKGGIYTFNEAPSGAANGGTKAGTGAQFGAQAMNVISGLGSANLRTNNPTGLSGLSFANNEGITGSGVNKITGGNLGAAGASNFCVPDYFSDMSTSTASSPNTTATDVTAGTAGQTYYKPASGLLKINGGTLANGTNQTIFVENANVEITNDIQYTGAPRGTVAEVPSFFLIVKNGNIRINPGVGRLDGAYIAQPFTQNGGVTAQTDRTGIINTCWVGNDTGSIYNQCKKQLIVNGAFVARQVLLSRSHSSLRYSQGGENNMDGRPARSCGNAGKDVPFGAPNAQDCAAEIFNFSPELYLSQPALNARFGAPSGKYDAITSLSPVL